MYSIRTATPTDLLAMPALERAAAAMFRQSPFPEMAEAPLAAEHIDPTRDRVWTIASDAELAGFVIARLYADAVHIQEIDVHPAHARRGLGARLIDCVAKWARANGHALLTLTTFDNVPWNGPYYARLGFSIVALDALNSSLRESRRVEELAGFPMEHRICMCRTL